MFLLACKDFLYLLTFKLVSLLAHYAYSPIDMALVFKIRIAKGAIDLGYPYFTLFYFLSYLPT